MIPGRVSQRGEELDADFNALSADNFATMNIAGFEGAFLTPIPNHRPGSRSSTKQWPSGINSVGQSYKRNGDALHTIQIVGVVRNSLIEDVYSLIGPAFYVPLSQAYTWAQTLQVRTAGSPQSIAQRF